MTTLDLMAPLPCWHIDQKAKMEFRPHLLMLLKKK
jgi:hypothetical protein